MIRLVQHHDAEAILGLVNANRDRLRPWMTWVDGHRSLSDTKRFITGSLLRYASLMRMDNLIIADDRPVGIVCFNWINAEHKAASLGYWIDAEFTSRGLATNACRELVDYAFCRLKLQRIEIRVSANNLQSRKVPLRLGFRHEGLLRSVEWLYDHFEDNDVFSLLRHEYPAQPSVMPRA
jgi:ribosomal-protein-serine acetyltransferase